MSGWLLLEPDIAFSAKRSCRSGKWSVVVGDSEVGYADRSEFETLGEAEKFIRFYVKCLYGRPRTTPTNLANLSGPSWNTQ